MKGHPNFHKHGGWPDLLASQATNYKFKSYPWIKYLSKRVWPKILNGGARILLTAPPQHGKSTFISGWVPPAYLKAYPDRKVILATYAQQYADKWGVICRDNLLNPMVGVPLRRDSKSKKRIVTTEGGQLITAGVGGPITGEGADLFIIDDPIKNFEDAMSPRKRETNIDWYRSVANTRLSRNASVVIMHTRWHEDDLIGILSQEPGWEHINLAALAEVDDPMGRAEGEALCPSRFNESDLEIKHRELGEMLWSALYQGSPIMKGGNTVKGEWIKYWTVLPKMDEVGIFADLTYKPGEENDYTVVEAWGRVGPDIYLIAQIRAQMGFVDQIAALGRMFDLYPDAFHKEIEEKANGAAVIELVKATYPGVTANNPKTEKGARLAAVAPLYHSGNVYYPDPNLHPWVKTNINEITRFPRAKNDDTVDTASMAVKYFGGMSSSMKALEALGRR